MALRNKPIRMFYRAKFLVLDVLIWRDKLCESTPIKAWAFCDVKLPQLSPRSPLFLMA